MNFLFISETLPVDTHASSVVFYRHFKTLVEKGHKVHILTDKNSYKNRKKELLSEFTIHIIPNRKWYYLPFKPFGLLQKLRFFDYYHLYTKKIIQEEKIDKLIGYVNGNFLIAFSAYVQKRTNLPLISFFHDDTKELNFGNDTKSVIDNTEKILDASYSVLIASAAFIENWQKYANKFVLLYPIPTSHDVNSDFVLKHLENHIGYSGTVYNEIIPSLDKFSSFLNELDFKFTIIGNNIQAKYLAERYKKLTYLSLFDTAEEANDFLLENCNVCIIAYPEKVKDMPWIKTCFPSKFIQYCILGIPTIIIAPENSALGKWCLANNWLLYSATYNIENIKALLNLVSTNKGVTDQVQHFKKNIFEPKIIQKQFEDLILDGK